MSLARYLAGVAAMAATLVPLALDPAAVQYRSVADLDGASDKAVRDAGAIAVTDVSRHNE